MFKHIHLQLFAEGGEGGSGLSGDFSADFASVFGSGEAKSSAAGDESVKTEEVASEDSAADEVQQDAPPATKEENDPDKEFEDLIKGKFKDQFGKRTQNIINQRFKSVKETEGRLQQLLDAVAPLTDKYGINEGDIDALTKAIKEDSSVFLQQALDADSSVDAYRENYFANREKRQQQEAEQAKAESDREMTYVNQKITEWRTAESELRKSYPEFNLDAECSNNQRFAEMLSNGMTVEEAFYATNFQRLATGIAAAATQNASKKAAETIAANRARPRESGAGVGAGIQNVRKSVYDMGKDDILDILKRVERGENISL